MVEIGLLVVIVFLSVIALYFDARNSWHATTILDGRMKLIVKGESLIDVIPNIVGKRYNRQTRELEDGEQPKGFLTRILGMYWVSFFYPMQKVLNFSIKSSRLKSKAERAGLSIKEWVEPAERDVDELLWKINFPVYCEVVLNDNYRIRLVVYLVLEVFNPYLAVMVYRGMFFEQVASIVESASKDYANDFTYSQWVQLDNGKGGTLTPHLLRMNVLAGDSGLIKEFGVGIDDAWVEGYELDEEDQATIEATKAGERERLLADGVRAKAQGQADSIRTVADAEEERAGKFIKGMTDQGVSPDMAAQVFNTQVGMENVKEAGLGTFVQGGAPGTPVAIQPTPRPEKDEEKKGGKK